MIVSKLIEPPNALFHCMASAGGKSCNRPSVSQSGFDLFDLAGTEKIMSPKVIDLLRGLGLNPLTSEVQKVLEDSELTNKEVDFPTFVTIYDQFSKRPSHANFADMIEAFKTMDREGNGKCFSGELKLVLNNIGDKMSDAEYEALIKPQEGEDGYIVYDKMIKAVMSG